MGAGFRCGAGPRLSIHVAGKGSMAGGGPPWSEDFGGEALGRLFG